MENKFKSNPYNLNNKLVTENDIINIMKNININDFKVNNIQHYIIAFIHKSYLKLNDYEEYTNPGNGCLELQNKSYETMEFLGDSILGSIVSSYIYNRFHLIYNENEGFLTKLKIRIVCGENLAKLSKDLKLFNYITLAKHIEDNCAGRENINILEDVFESFNGAIYLDNNYETVKNILIQIIEKYVDFTDILLKDTNYKDQISRYFQQNFQIYPKYLSTKDKDNTFQSKLIHGDNIISNGTGTSKKKAEQDASRKALIHFNVLA